MEKPRKRETPQNYEIMEQIYIDLFLLIELNNLWYMGRADKIPATLVIFASKSRRQSRLNKV